MLVAHVLPLSC